MTMTKNKIQIRSLSVKGESTDHYTKEDCKKFIEIFHYKYYVGVFFQFSPLKDP